MVKTFQEIFPALQERLEQARQGALPLGHAMELRRREKRQAMGCPSDEEICGFVDGELRAYSTRRWAEVSWHVRRCQHCQDDVEGLCDALGVDMYDVSAAKPKGRRLMYVVAPVVAVAAIFVMAVIGVQAFLPPLVEEARPRPDVSHVESISPDDTPALVHRQQTAKPTAAIPSDSAPRNQKSTSTMPVSIPADTGRRVPSALQVAICSETERPTCGEGMVVMSEMGAECKVIGDENSCVAKSPSGGCAICLVSK